MAGGFFGGFSRRIPRPFTRGGRDYEINRDCFCKGYLAEVFRFKMVNVGSFRERYQGMRGRYAAQGLTTGKALMTKCAMNVIGYACGHYSAMSIDGRKGSFITR